MKKLLNNIYKILATGLGAGYSPIAPGTMGALLGCLIWVILFWLGFSSSYLWCGIIIIGILVGVFVSDKLEVEWGKDSSKIVIDEVVGMWIALIMQPFSFQNLIIAFVLFRLFDIYKPFYIKRLEKLKGGLGVMSDDILAGIYANIILTVFRLYI